MKFIKLVGYFFTKKRHVIKVKVKEPTPKVKYEVPAYDLILQKGQRSEGSIPCYTSNIRHTGVYLFEVDGRPVEVKPSWCFKCCHFKQCQRHL